MEKRGFIVSPMASVGLLLFAGLAMLYLASADSANARAVSREGEQAFVLSEFEARLSAIKARVYEGLADNSLVNQREELEALLERQLWEREGVNASVELGPAPERNTRVRITLRSARPIQRGSSSASLGGHNLSWIAGHPFYAFYEAYQAFRASEVCAYANFTSCSFNASAFSQAKRERTGLVWLVNVTQSDCSERRLAFTAALMDESHVATLLSPFRLRDRGSGGLEHQARC